MKKKRPVLQDVADRVGVTKMTVSRFLRNPEQVSVALRGKIAAALDELGYIPNRAPDILSNATSRAIGVLLPSLTNQVFAEVLRGIESVTDAHGYQTMLAHYGYKPEMEQERLESMLSWNIDGLILTERTHTPRTLKMIEVAGPLLLAGIATLPISAHVSTNVLSSNRRDTNRRCWMQAWCRIA